MRVTSKELRRRIRRILSEGPSPADDTTFSHNKLQDMFVSTGELNPLEMRYTEEYSFNHEGLIDSKKKIATPWRPVDSNDEEMNDEF